MRNSIRTRLTVAFIGLAIGPLLLVGIVLAWQSFTTQQQQALNLQREVAQRVSTQVTAFFEGLENELRLTSQVQGLQKLDQDKQRSVLSELLSYHYVFEELALLDSKGQEQVHLSRSSFAPGLRDRSTTDEFIASQTSGQTYYSSVRFEEATGEPLMTLAVPLLDARTGQVDGALVSEVRIKKIWDLIADVQVSPGQSVYIVNTQGQLVAHRNRSMVLAGTSFRVPDQAGIQPGLGGSRVVLAVDKVSVGEQAFNIVAEQTVSEALALAFNTVLITGGLIVVALVVSGSLGFVTVRQIVRPIQTMAAAAQAISSGDLSQQIRITRQDELGVLANAFNSMTTQLQSLIGGLEQRVAERTAEISQANKQLSRQANQLQASTQVSRAATTLVDPDQLIPRVVELIQQRFGFYYVGLFLVDPDNRYVVLEAGTSEAGRIMKERGHRLEIGGQSMVGWASANRKARIALDVGQEPVRFANPLLPETHSEMALPLLAGERVLGALDVQSTEVAAFDRSDIVALQGMADQIAVALENARLFRQTQAALQELEKANRTMVREGWEGYLERQGGTRRAEFAPPSAPAAEALAQALSIPLELRGQPIGRLTLRREEDHPWSDEEVDMLRAIALQTVMAADNIRLFEQTQHALDETRALYETSREITSAADIREVLAAVMDNLARTGTHAAAIALFDAASREQARHIEMAGTWDYKGTPRLAPGTRFAIADFPLFDRITRDTALISHDLLADPQVDDMAKMVLGGLGFRAMAVTPLVARGQWIGVMFAMMEQAHEYTPSELSFQRALADQAAVAIDGRRLLAETQRRAERERLIRQITTRIRAASDTPGILATTATELAQSMGVPRAIVRLTMGRDVGARQT